ncbi:MAG TPA: hypothetical protein VMA86_08140, partial [Acetobacteraceae bacterium]|nr:hypothetical protein [Acetobacteraceae bacterium]
NGKKFSGSLFQKRTIFAINRTTDSRKLIIRSGMRAYRSVCHISDIIHHSLARRILCFACVLLAAAEWR